MKRTLFIVLSCLCIGWGAQSQEIQRQWSLEECIRYAIDHNIDIRQRKLQKDNAEIDLNTTKMSRLPNLNAGMGQSWSFGRSNNNLTGIYENRSSSNSSFSISSSTPLFTGFRIPNEIERDKLNLQAAVQNLEKAKEDLSLQVANLFLQVLFNKEILKINEEQLNFSTEQITRTEVLVDAGKVPRSQLYDIKAQAAKDELSVVQARNNLELSLLDLAQSLELESTENFDVSEPQTPDVIEAYMQSVIPPDAVYDHAVHVKPAVKEQEFRVESSKKEVKIAQAGYMPTLSLSLGYNNNYFYNYKSDNNTSFADQIKNNGGENIGLSLSIPIFNRFQVRNRVRSARLGILNQELILENVKKTLYKEIQTAYLNAVSSQEKYRSSEKAVEASRESFKYAEERYGVGKSSVFEFNEAKTKLLQSQSEQIQAKYDYIFRAKILDFYNGIPIKL
jgi:Outer membrane protein